jgi:endonuclease YncB( thermonuclease family)
VRLAPLLQLLSLVLLIPAAPTKGATAAERKPPLPLAAVAEVIDGDTLRLEDGREVRLAGVTAPKPPLSLAAGRRWPLADTARAALAALVDGRAVALRPVTGTSAPPRPADGPAVAGDAVAASLDRHGRVRAHIFRDDGLWVQGELLRQGLARVHTTPDDTMLAGAMLAREREARTTKRGVWGDPFYVVRRADEAGRFVDSFQLVEGCVLDAVRGKGQVFLNFGPDWRTDFTVRIAGSAALARFRVAEDGGDPLALKGKIVRVRGWLLSRNGPLIDVTHPEQIETIAPCAAPAARSRRGVGDSPPPPGGTPKRS